MSDRGAPVRQQSIDYVAQLLRMNPIHQGGEIIRARNELLRLETGESGAADASVSRQQARNYRVEALEKLSSVRTAFWTLPLAELNAQLDVFESLAFDDLKRAARRLQIVARHRETFLALVGTPPVDAEFGNSLKEVLVLSPRDTVILREHVLDTFGVRASRKSGKRILRTLKVQLPTVYEIELEWFDSLCREKAGSSRFRFTTRGGRPRAVTQGNSKFRYTWLIVFAASVAARLIPALQSNEKVSKPYSSEQFNRPYQSEQLIERPRSEPKSVTHEPPSFSNKEIWQPYESPYTTSPQQPSRVLNGSTYQQTTRPRDQSPDIPAIKLDDRYSR